MNGVSLNARGEREARRLGTWLQGAAIDVLATSPLERCLQTAAAIGSATGLTPHVFEELTEIDFGAWTGRPFEDLAEDPAWRRFNTVRSEASVPGGETMREAQRRVVAAAERLSRSHPDEVVAVVSHGDVIKAMIAHALGVGLDHLQHFEIAPASVSTLTRETCGWRVVALNESPEPGHARVRSAARSRLGTAAASR